MFFIFKTIANSNGQIRRPCVDAANDFIRLISLINSYLALFFFSFFYDNVFAFGCIQYLTLIIMALTIIRFYEETQCIEIIEKADYQHQNTGLSLKNEWDSRHEEILPAKRFQTLFP